MVDPVTAFVGEQVASAVIGAVVTPVIEQLKTWAKTAWQCKEECGQLALALEHATVKRLARELDELSAVSSFEDFREDYQKLGDLLEEAEYVVAACRLTARWNALDLVQIGKRVKAVSAKLLDFATHRADGIGLRLQQHATALQAQKAARRLAAQVAKLESFKVQKHKGDAFPQAEQRTFDGIIFQHLDLLVPALEKRMDTHRNIGIVGMAGLGKTTIADKIYADKKGSFGRHFFIPVSEKPNIVGLLQDAWRQLHPGSAVPFDTPESGRAALARALQKSATLLVLDDVWSMEALELLNFATLLNQRHEGSILIVTTRNSEVLNNLEDLRETHVEEPRLLSKRNSLKLLCHHAFAHPDDDSQEQVPDDALPKELSDEPFNTSPEDDVVKARDAAFLQSVETLFPGFGQVIVDMLMECKGLPLALQVLGSSLKDKPVGEWQRVIELLRKIDPNLDSTRTIRAICQPSYDALPPHLKQCFMDFAAYPEDARVPEDELAALWAATATIPTTLEWGREQLRQLKLRSLVVQVWQGVYMHDILRDLAVLAAIKSPDHCYLKEGKQVPATPASAPDASTAQSVHSPSPAPAPVPGAVAQPPAAPSSTSNASRTKQGTRFLDCFGCFHHSDASSPDVKSAEFNERARKASAPDVPPTAVATIRKASFHSLDLQDLTLKAPSLRMLYLQKNDLSQAIPELGAMTRMRVLSFSENKCLESVTMIDKLLLLRVLDLSECKGLTALPVGIGNLSALQKLDLSWCSGLTALPDGIGNLRALQQLRLLGCNGLTALPDGIGNLSALQQLDLPECRGLTSLPDGIANLSALQEMDLEHCKGLTALPNGFGNLSALQWLNLSRCKGLTALPDGFKNLSALTQLHLSECEGLTALPDGIGNLSALQWLDLSACKGLTELPGGIGNLSALQQLHLYKCSWLTALPDGIGNLSALQKLDLSLCEGLTALPDGIGDLSALQQLDLSGCKGLTALPAGIANLSALKKLSLSECTKVCTELEGATALHAWVMELKHNNCYVEDVDDEHESSRFID